MIFKCATGEMAVKDVFSGITQMQIQRGWKKRTEPDTDQPKRCSSDRAGSADRSTFVLLDTEGKEKKAREKSTARWREREREENSSPGILLFQVSSLEAATRTRVTG